MDKPVKLFIVEGEDRDYRFITRMIETFFTGKYESKVICLPAQANIYMLYLTLKNDDFETDIVEILRERVGNAKEVLKDIDRQSIDEVFLFFDYDAHQNNMPKGSNPETALQEMLETFSNETENGKLYISYPMIEALYDYKIGECQNYTGCFLGLDQFHNYKSLSGNGNPNASRTIDIEDWKAILATFYLRIKCLFEKEILDYEWYKNHVSSDSVYTIQKKLLETRRIIFVLSALPEFLFDYFKINFWNSHTQRKRLKYQFCTKKSKN